ncbi:hypothetical protein VSS92_28240, partial [Pseudomonas syringae pv. tagetis]
IVQSVLGVGPAGQRGAARRQQEAAAPEGALGGGGKGRRGGGAGGRGAKGKEPDRRTNEGGGVGGWGQIFLGIGGRNSRAVAGTRFSPDLLGGGGLASG